MENEQNENTSNHTNDEYINSELFASGDNITANLNHRSDDEQSVKNDELSQRTSRNDLDISLKNDNLDGDEIENSEHINDFDNEGGNEEHQLDEHLINMGIKMSEAEVEQTDRNDFDQETNRLEKVSLPAENDQDENEEYDVLENETVIEGETNRTENDDFAEEINESGNYILENEGNIEEEEENKEDNLTKAKEFREEGEVSREERDEHKDEGETNGEEVEEHEEDGEINRREEEEGNIIENVKGKTEYDILDNEENAEERDKNKDEKETNDAEETDRDKGEKINDINEKSKDSDDEYIHKVIGNEDDENEDSKKVVNKANQFDDESSNQIDLPITDEIKINKSDERNSSRTSERNENKIEGVSKFFTAPVQLDDGSVKNKLVTIVRSKAKKAFLGGYRHKVTGVVYHHASVQTMPKARPPPTVELFSRDTQTFQLKHQKINTDSTTSTQMTAPGLFVSNVTDKLMAPKQYETADDYKERILKNIVIIQKYYRRWLAKHVVDDKRKQRDDRLQWEETDKHRKQHEKDERIQNEYKRRMHPKTKADFDLLYSDLEKWREEQLSEIESSDITESEKKARKALLLEEETDLLAAIDRHKLDRKEETKTESVQRLLSKAAAPKTWKDAKGRKIEMNTQFTIRSRELLEIFNSLNMQYLTPDERLDVLLTLKHTVKEHDCKLTKEIVELVDREADLIMRNVKEASLVGLRKRISTLFLQYCKTPTFNPQISSLLKVPSDSSALVGDINYCKYCGRYLRSTEFSLSTKSSKLTICKSCSRKDNQSRNRQDYSHYRRILKEIQMHEQEIGDGSKIAFIFKQNDVKSLIESVWDGKSVMSGCDDLDELMFMRWDNRDHWSPWNTIFLTKEEGEAHIKVTNLSDTYSNVLINRITQKHVIAKSMFGSLEKMIGDFQAKTTKITVKV